MIAILDPLWLVRPDPLDEKVLAEDINGLMRLLTEVHADLRAVESYWDPLWTELAHPLAARLTTPEAKAALNALRRKANRAPVPALAAPGRVRGCKQMFGQSPVLAGTWEARMQISLLRLAMLGQPLILLTRPVVDRNIRRHSTGNLSLDEVTRWCVYAQPGTSTFIRVPCVRVKRQLDIPWTQRFDHRLPGPQDGARYPFCPPSDWDNPDRTVVFTRASKPAMVDTLDNAWTRPNINAGAGHHWDVFLGAQKLRELIGVDQLNIVELGAPAGEKKAGDIHHIPTTKAGKVNDVGWACAS